jgi:16S rRNA (guanine527-N7)-methyltransferase
LLASALATRPEMTTGGPGGAISEELGALARRYGLSSGAQARLSTLLDLLADDRLAPTSVRAPEAILRDHLADSLVALELSELHEASAIADVGSGAGLPGLPLAIGLPRAQFSLIESRQPKARFIARAVRACGLGNVRVVHKRVEECPDLAEKFDVVTVRALAPLDVVAEYAAPLLTPGGALVAWRGRHDPSAESATAQAGEVLGLEVRRSVPVRPYAEVRERHLYLMVKVRVTPERFPRRSGMAQRRPLGRDRGRAPEIGASREDDDAPDGSDRARR